MVEYPPPRVLWVKLLKRCSTSDLDFFRFDTLIRIALQGGIGLVQGDNELAVFLHRVIEESDRRTKPCRSR